MVSRKDTLAYLCDVITQTLGLLSGVKQPKKTAVATILILADWLKKLASITSPLTFLNVS